jgi:hypothetical protein
MTDEPPKPWMVQDRGADVSFMITLAQKLKLRQLGYDETAISAMTPQDAHRILALRA